MAEIESVNSDLEIVEPLTKTWELEGAAKYTTKFNPEWSKRLSCIQPAPIQYKFKCTICERLVNCQHQREKHERRHLESQKHCSNAKLLEYQQSVTTFFKSIVDPMHEKVTRAKVK